MNIACIMPAYLVVGAAILPLYWNGQVTGGCLVR